MHGDTVRAGRTADAPLPSGPYSQSLRTGSMVFCSGQGGIRPDGTIESTFGAQLRVAIDNIRATLVALDASLRDVVQVRVYLTDPDQFAEMNSIYAEAFAEPYPTRTTITVRLPDPLLVEIDAVAVIAASPDDSGEHSNEERRANR